MRTAGISPQAPRMIFRHRALGQQQLWAFRPIAQKHDRKCPMKRPLHVGLQFRGGPDFAVPAVHQDQQVIASWIVCHQVVARCLTDNLIIHLRFFGRFHNAIFGVHWRILFAEFVVLFIVRMDSSPIPTSYSTLISLSFPKTRKAHPFSICRRAPNDLETCSS